MALARFRRGAYISRAAATSLFNGNRLSAHITAEAALSGRLEPVNGHLSPTHSLDCVPTAQ